ncbi:MAG: AraC family transcriptional regulator [Planctomycetes bacterium]|nr:AraC family transcriptional regulator [Planctomycetota bacterium]
MFFSGLLGRDETPPDLFVNTIGRCTSRGRFRYRLDSAFFHMRFMLAGSGHGDCRGRRLELTAGDVALFWPGQAIDLRDRPEEPWDFIWLELAGKNVPWAIRRAGFGSEHTVWRLGPGNEAVAQAVAVFERFKRGRLPPLYPIMAGWQLLAHTAELANLVPEPDKSLDVGEASRRFILACDHQVGTTELAQHLHMSRTSLFRIFVRQYGVPPKEFIERIRLEQACYLLSCTALSVRDIATRCHYKDSEYFARRFRRFYNSNPMHWRRTVKAGVPRSAELGP